MWNDIVLLIDFGSTFTKVAMVNLREERIIARAQSPSTVATDMTIGLFNALQKLEVATRKIGGWEKAKKLACSSAAGGLKLTVIGLVPELTLEAGKRAALGAGAKIIGTYAYELTDEDMKKIENSMPDLVLLVGGTDGGNKDVILHNGKMLSRSKISAPIIVAGNRVVSSEIKEILKSAGKTVEVTENVLPEIDKVNVDPVRSLIREVFIRRIVHAKGLDRAQEYIGDILMPTPMATLKAAKLLAEGTDGESGLGEIMVVEVGGATTNVHTVSKPLSSESGVILKGLPEPYAKRTVEGDLGIRYNAYTILEVVGIERIKKLTSLDTADKLIEKISLLPKNVEFVPEKEEDRLLDIALARVAVEMAVERHVGYVKEWYTPMGPVWVQYGKDCTGLKAVIGTGGIFAYGLKPQFVLDGALFEIEKPHVLKPRSPVCYIDANYILYGIGLLSDYEPQKALRIAKRSLKVIT